MLGHLNYLDISPEKRAEAAAKARDQLRAAIMNPAITAEQRADLQARLTRLNQWAAGTLPSSASTRTPQNHSVGLDETVELTEKV